MHLRTKPVIMVDFIDQLNFNTSKTKTDADVKMGQGFVASAGQETIEDDPLGQQIYNLKKFIQQAKEAGKYDDARILENNLKDLQEEYKRLKADEQDELFQNYEQFHGLFSKSGSDEEQLDESNPFFEEDQDDKNPFKDNGDEYDQSGKNPFS